MKPKLLLILLIILFGCDMPDFKIDKEMRLRDGTPFIISTYLNHNIIKIDGGVASDVQMYDANYYYQHDNLSERQYILTCFHLDCNERIEPIKWRENGDYFTFYVYNSTRFLKGTRLVLFKVSDKKANILLDIRDKQIATYFFEDDYFNFKFLNATDTIRVKL